MLEDLSAHMLDIAENSVMAEGTEIRIEALRTGRPACSPFR